MENISISIIVPVYNRPDEIRELLDSLVRQTDSEFEVLVVEDGSRIPCEDVCESFKDKLNIKYFFKPDTGRSDTRNFGMEHASGNYFIIFDDDCIMPEQYVATVKDYLQKDYVDCFGGPDNADSSFTVVQKAINYSMTSVMTTGGIRGATKNVDNFSPRSFNMGLSKTCFKTVGGFKNMIGEDIDMSFRIREAGFKSRLFPKAYVFHKRKIDFKKFYRQVYTFGRGRLLLNKLHPGSLKIVHLLPSCFVLGNVFLVVMALFLKSWLWILPLLVYILCLFLDSLFRNKSIKVAALSIVAAYVQLFGYGLGFIDEVLTHKSMKKTQEELYG